MELFKKYFKFPLTYTEGYPSFVFDSDNNRAIDFLIDSPVDEVRIIKVLNGEFKDTIEGEFCHEDGTIYLNDKQLLMVRSWGRLTSPNCEGLSSEMAAKVQDSFCDWIIDRLKSKNYSNHE